MKQRLRKSCPKCNKLSISLTKSTKKYRCWKCKAEFEIPKVRVMQHKQIALRVDLEKLMPSQL